MYYTPGMTSEEIETESPKRPRWTDYLSLDEVEPALANAKRHDLEAIAASYDRFGYVEPITMDERTGRLVAGHGRIASLLGRRIRGESAPEGIVVGDDGWLVPVGRGWASANDYEARAYLIASNRLTEAGEWDRAELWQEASELAGQGAGLEGLGISAEYLSALERFYEASGEQPTSPDSEWVGMPEFEQKDLRGAVHAVIHFRTQEDADRFFTLIERPRASTLWWPEGDGLIGSVSHEAYVLDGDT